MEINEIGERCVAIGVHSQEAVKVPRGIHEEVLEPLLQAVGEGVAPDFLTDPDQKCSLSHVLQEIFCILSANDSWFKKEKKKEKEKSAGSSCPSACLKGREVALGLASSCLEPLRGHPGPE